MPGVMSMSIEKELCRCLRTANLTDDERRRLLVFLTECVAAILKVDAKISN